MIRVAALFCLLFAMAAVPSSAQLLIGVSMSNSGGGAATNPGCANQLVFDYSNSCALIAQAWGQ